MDSHLPATCIVCTLKDECGILPGRGSCASQVVWPPPALLVRPFFFRFFSIVSPVSAIVLPRFPTNIPRFALGEHRTRARNLARTCFAPLLISLRFYARARAKPLREQFPPADSFLPRRKNPRPDNE